MRNNVRTALGSIAARFSSDAPSVDLQALARRYGAIEGWPADAEFGLAVLAWVLGSGFTLPRLQKAVTRRRLLPDFQGAARAIGPGGSPSLITLGGVARSAFENAAVVVRWNFSPDTLYWPMRLSPLQGTFSR